MLCPSVETRVIVYVFFHLVSSSVDGWLICSVLFSQNGWSRSDNLHNRTRNRIKNETRISDGKKLVVMLFNDSLRWPALNERVE